MGRIIPNVWKNKKMFQTTNKFNLIWFNWENDPKKWDNRPRSSQGGNEWE